MSNETLIKLTKAIAKREIDSGREPSSVILEWSSVVVTTLEGNHCKKCNGSGELSEVQPSRVTAQQKGVDFKRKRFYEKPEVKAAREELEWQLRKYAPEQPMDGPIELDVVWFYKTSTKKQDGAYKITRPDTDNLVKMLKDAMGNVGFFHDDAQIVIEHTSKRWGLVAGTYITIKALPQKVEG